MTTEITFNLPIGTMLLANDGFCEELGQICDIESTRWGQHYVVVMADGTFRTAHSVDPDCSSKIGWSVASPQWIARLS
jgi:hypothetical protein